MQDIVDAAEADGVTIERTWQNMADTIQLVFNSTLKGKAWVPNAWLALLVGPMLVVFGQLLRKRNIHVK